MSRRLLTQLAVGLILALAIGFGAAHLSHTTSQTTPWGRTVEDQRARSDEGNVASGHKLNTDSDPSGSAERCRAILENLCALSFNSQSELQALQLLRTVRAQVETLVAMDSSVIPLLIAFLENGRDVHYPVYLFARGRLLPRVQRDSAEDRGDWLGRREIRPTVDLVAFAFPPSARIAVLEVLFRSRRPEALAKILLLSRGFVLGAELAYASRMWLENGGDPGQRKVFAERATQLMSNDSLAKSAQEDLLLEWQADYLMSLINLSSGLPSQTAFNPVLLTADGSVNLNVLDHCVNQMGVSVIPLLRRTFEDARLTDLRQRAYIAGLAVDYVGIDLAANEFFKSAILDDSLPEIAKLMLIQSLNGYNMFKKDYAAVTPETISLRVNLMNEFQANANNLPPAIQEAISRVTRTMKFAHNIP